MIFRIRADATFEAADVEEALRLLAAHFHALHQAAPPPKLLRSGRISVGVADDPMWESWDREEAD
jgi:hypothetical protein